MTLRNSTPGNLTQGNPLIPRTEVATPEPPDIADELLGDAVALNGPQEPLLVGSLPEGVPAWPRVEVAEHRLITVTGLHGGAGTSTVARLFGDDAFDAGQGWPVAAGWARPLPILNVVVVARTHHVGLGAADQFARQWTAGELPESRLLGLVLVDDGPRLLSFQAQQTKRLLQMTPMGARLPWNEQWRIKEPDTNALPRRIKKIIRSYRALAHQQQQTPQQERQT